MREVKDKRIIMLVVAIFLAIAMISQAQAQTTYYRQSRNITRTQSVTDNNDRGDIIRADFNVTLFNVTLNETAAATSVKLYNATSEGSKVELASCSVSSLTCELNYPLYENQKYMLVPSAGGASHRQPYQGSISSYVNDSYIDWIESGYWAAGGSWSNSTGFDWGVKILYVGVETGGGGGGESPSITLSTNLTSYTNSTDNPFFFSIDAVGTVQNATDLWDINVYLNGTLNQTHSNVPNLNTTVYSINLTYGTDQVGYDVNVTVQEVGGSAVDSFLRNNIFLDSVTPQIATSINNNSILYRHIDTLSGNFTFSDTNLLAANFTIRRLNPDGSTNATLNNTYYSQINATSLELNFTVNPGVDSSYSDGRYAIFTEVWDSHTRVIIPDYEWDKYQVTVGGTTYKGISFNNNVFNISTDDYARINDFALLKRQDRYLFGFNFTDTGTPIDLYLGSKRGMQYLPDSEYQGHFVVGNHWIDFESDDISDLSVAWLPNFGVWRVRFTPQKNVVIFRSIGDLNYANTTYYFNVTSGFTMYAQDFFTSVAVANFTVGLYNGTTLVSNKTADGYNVTFNITGGTLNATLTHPSYADNSTAITFAYNSSFTWNLFGTNSLYIFIYDEQTDNLINFTNVTVQVINYANQSQEYSTDTGSTFQSGFSIGDYELRYWADNYAQRSYYTTITSATTQSIDLYLLNSTPTTNTYKNIQVVDESGVQLSNATVDMRRFYIDCNCFKTVEMAKTNDVGKTFTFAQLYDSVYRFYIFYEGSLKKISSDIRLDTRDLYITVPITTSGIQGFTEVTSGVVVALTFNDTTGLWDYTYSAPTSAVTSGTLKVRRETLYSTTELFSQQVNSSSSSIQYNMSSYINETGTFIGVAYLTSLTTNSTLPVSTEAFSYQDSVAVYGLTGVFLAFIIIAVMAFVGAYNPVVSIALAIVGFLVTNAAGLYYMNFAYVIGIVIVGGIFMVKVRT